MRIPYRGNVSTEPLPSNDRERQIRTQTETWSYKPTFFFQNKKSWLKNRVGLWDNVSVCVYVCLCILLSLLWINQPRILSQGAAKHTWIIPSRDLKCPARTLPSCSNATKMFATQRHFGHWRLKTSDEQLHLLRSIRYIPDSEIITSGISFKLIYLCSYNHHTKFELNSCWHFVLAKLWLLSMTRHYCNSSFIQCINKYIFSAICDSIGLCFILQSIIHLQFVFSHTYHSVHVII
jgi:hypothetical protein